MTDNPDTGWIVHDGGPCPVDPRVRVEVVLMDGYGRSDYASEFDWNREFNQRDIQAYRIIPTTYQHEDGKPAADMEDF